MKLLHTAWKPFRDLVTRVWCTAAMSFGVCERTMFMRPQTADPRIVEESVVLATETLDLLMCTFSQPHVIS